MIWWRRSPQVATIDCLYGTIVAQARLPVFYTDYDVADTVEGRFEMLVLPGQRHGYGPDQPYFTQRMWDFFADHLLGDRQAGADIYEKRENHAP